MRRREFITLPAVRQPLGRSLRARSSTFKIVPVLIFAKGSGKSEKPGNKDSTWEDDEAAN
jgi:hypothetical protein